MERQDSCKSEVHKPGENRMRARATLLLLAVAVAPLAAVHVQPRPCCSANASSGGLRGSREEEDAAAELKYPGWTTCAVNPWELSGKYEGDMLVANRSELKNVLRDPNRKWPDRVPYRYDRRYLYESEIQEIEEVIWNFNHLTCVDLQHANDDDEDYLLITGKRTGCCVNIGRIGGKQELNLEPPVCIFKTGCIYHQIMHALGFIHEHNAPSRDRYVTIVWENIEEGKAEFFKKMHAADVTDYGVDYDYASIMHGSRKMFSKNGKNTIETKDEFAVIGQRQRLSEGDIHKINRHHNCL